MPPASLSAAAFWTPACLAQTLQGDWLTEPQSPHKVLRGVSIDTRTLQPGQAFFAIPGSNFDGHDFLHAAADRGAALAIVEKKPPAAPPALPLLRVPSAIAALQTLAQAWRDVLSASGCRVIAVAGSNGKTTARNLIHTALSARLRGTQSPKSFNNHLGVPLTLLAAPAEDDFIVVEIGSNHPGEIAALAQIARPDIGVITSIGHEHLEFFGTIENVAREEASLLAHLRPGGTAVVCDEPGQWPPTVPLDMPDGVTLLRFGTAAGCDLRVESPVQTTPTGITFRLTGPAHDPEAGIEGPAQVRRSGKPPAAVEVRLPLLGAHNALNAAAALAVARLLDVDDEAALAALARAKPMPGRMEPIALGHGVTLIHDAYNANPSSARAAIDQLLQMPGRRRIAILGDMFELGQLGPDAHRDLGRYLSRFAPQPDPDDPAAHAADSSALTGQVHLAILIGRLSMFTAETLAKAWPPGRVQVLPDWSDDLPDRVAAWTQPGDTILLKASRGMRLERLIPAMEARWGRAGPA